MATDKNSSNNNNNKQEGQHLPASPLDRYTAQPQQNNDSGNSPFYKSAAPTISLPKGGGALKGIDEKFQVNAVNGTAGLDIPFPLSPGRGGFTPALSAGYNSGSGNSIFGLGWNLSLPSIQRRTDKKLPRYNDDSESDVFILAGAEDMIPELDTDGNRISFTSGIYTVCRYRPRIEGLFARIEYIRRTGTAEGWWRVTTKDNIITYYGLTPEGRITDPEHSYRIFKWLPQIVADHKGNVQLYSYVSEDTKTSLGAATVAASAFERNRLNGLAAMANTYLKRVQYCNGTPFFIDPAHVYEPALPDAGTNFLMEAILDYGDHSTEYATTPDQPWQSRNDAFSDFHAGFEIRTYRRCKRVLMFHHFSELDGNDLVRTLEFSYRNGDYDINNPSVATEADFLVSAVQRGYRNVGGTWHSKALPPMTFDYQPLSWNTTIASVDRDNFSGAVQGLTGPYQWMDFEGEGISGIMTEQGNGWFYKNNLGDGHFDTPKAIALKPSFTGLGSGLHWQDLDADGRRQVVADAPVKGYWELDDPSSGTQETLQWQPFRAFRKNSNIDWSSPFTKMLDLDGDGRADILITEDRAWTWYENLGTEGFDKGGNTALFTDEEKGPLLLLRDEVQSIFLADMNGDGMTDLVRIKNGEVCYWPNMGYGRFGAKVTMPGAPLFTSPDIYNPLYITLADISGTGAADIIYVGNNRCTAWINLSGNAFGEAHEINPLPGTDTYSKIAVLDFLGNGTACIVWSSPLPQYAYAPLQYIDLMGGSKPYLMRSYNNSMGKSVSVTYKTSTQYYLADKLAGISWATRLPFPVHCVASVTTADSVSDTSYTQLYAYRHGYYDHAEREFRGFGYVETTDVDKAIISGTTSLDQAPVLTRTWYHTGAWMREGTLLDRFKEEYFQFEGWDNVTVIASFTPGLNAQELREAHRALKGSALRQEVYALDGSDKQYIPYSVTANTYLVKQVQQLRDNRYASFINLQEQSIAFSCERDITDPRIVHSLTLETDGYGNVLQSAQVAYHRLHYPMVSGLYPQKVKDTQQLTHITCSENTYTNDILNDDVYYRLRVPYEAKSYEANFVNPQGNLYTVAELQLLINGDENNPPAERKDFTETPQTGAMRLLSHGLSLFYQDDTLAALGFGMIESLALPYEHYTLAYTPDVISMYGTRIMSGMPEEGRYYDLLNNGSYWLRSGTIAFDTPLLKFYTPETFIDPWGNTTEVTFWKTDPADANAVNYWLLPQKITTAANTIGASGITDISHTAAVLRYDWQTLQPQRMQDANNNISEVLYDALGMPVAMALKSKDDNTEGDTLDGLDIFSPADAAAQLAFFTQDPDTHAPDLLEYATWRCVYDLDSLPAAVGMIAREYHTYQEDYPDPAPLNDILIRLSYSDGMGRILMHKAASPGPDPVPAGQTTPATGWWIGSGRTIYNNKGKTVMQYEPYFSNTFLCDTAEQSAAAGVSPEMFYDALGRLCRTNLPDGSYTKNEWTAWEQIIYDNNDTVILGSGPAAVESDWYKKRITGGSLNNIPEEADAAAKTAAHADTPTIIHTDTLARAFYTIQQDTQATYIHSYVTLDIQGNRLSVTDGRNLTPLTYSYNLLQQPFYQHSADSGDGYTLTDIAGQPMYHWDADDRRFEILYDRQRRPEQQKVLTTPAEGSVVKLLEVYIYGEGQANDTANNLRGQLYQHKDGSGLQQIDRYDFKGNPLSTSRQLLDDVTLTDADWNTAPALHPEVFTSSVTYDALNRPMKQVDPGNNVTRHTFDKAGALTGVYLTPDGSTEQTYVQDIHYDAKGQRQAIWYGNGTKTSYTYDPYTFRLRRLLTVNVNAASPNNNQKLQDLNYYYDPVGNITQIRDDVQEPLFYNNSIIPPTQDYTYDALYRLVTAKGRELVSTPGFGGTDSWSDAPAPAPLGSNAARNYTQNYTYDEVGNIRILQHSAGTGSYTRTFNYGTIDNRLTDTTINNTVPSPYTYSYDTRGNMFTMPHLSNMGWNVRNELNTITRGDTLAYYQYSGGQRIRKYVNNGSVREERIYLGSFELYRKYVSGTTIDVERSTVHISDDTGRIAMLEVLNPAHNSDGAADVLTRYIYSNHLQSATLELDENAEMISYEEYHPYGTTAYQAKSGTINAVAKRYRYTGKERDEESGLYYHGARYYIPWLCRWSACDPLESKYAPQSPYVYCSNNPINKIDPDGKGDYYTKEGVKLKSDDRTVKTGKGKNAKQTPDDKAYISSQAIIDANTDKKGKIDWDQVIKQSTTLSISNSTLGKYIRTVRQESSGAKHESYAIASAIVNLSRLKGTDILTTLKSNGIYGYNGTEQFNNDKYGREAVFNALTGGHDYSNGAIKWDGFDLAAKGFEHPKPKREVGVEISKAHFNAFKSAWTDTEISIFSDGKYTTFATNFSSGIHPAVEGVNKGRVLFKSTAVEGKTMFWGVNKDPIIYEGHYYEVQMRPLLPWIKTGGDIMPKISISKIHPNKGFTNWKGV